MPLRRRQSKFHKTDVGNHFFGSGTVDGIKRGTNLRLSQCEELPLPSGRRAVLALKFPLLKAEPKFFATAT